jgi:hypothetical protein
VKLRVARDSDAGNYRRRVTTQGESHAPSCCS